ncbi:hypothetical protein [Hymenobacter swuensis]|uniref:Uncharacterized protein n=1 Tax=Hymenobacter swuensis DY53 TaxID=1227739 RepID=W8EWJ8_9BACT|nr:hypothetical protein [Hymenobacter swuensis]AHJ96918.1 hypothetical protein Hsw_1323 [Hymenobacter swuensis DY53]
MLSVPDDLTSLLPAQLRPIRRSGNVLSVVAQAQLSGGRIRQPAN